MHHMRIECDGKKTALGCQVLLDMACPTREECNKGIFNAGWRLWKSRTLCNLCIAREFRPKGSV